MLDTLLGNNNIDECGIDEEYRNAFYNWKYKKQIDGQDSEWCQVGITTSIRKQWYLG